MMAAGFPTNDSRVRVPPPQLVYHTIAVAIMQDDGSSTVTYSPDLIHVSVDCLVHDKCQEESSKVAE